jgi:A/G-specific adenine glycosylase
MRRVLHRLFVGVDLPQPTATDAELLRLAEAAVPKGRGWHWNQGLMDFGARLCTARRPACSICPLQSRCRAFPAIQTAIANRPPATAVNPAYRYEDSNRFLRGRVLARLRDASLGEGADDGIAIKDLGGQIRDDFGDGDVPWLYRVIESLQKDGLAVAEERPVYDAGSEPEPDRLEVRVKLP